ncbi:MAG: MBL fold metallo-hydrolase [Simkaniaceae bacterium]|nr:MBL fold metallo-hydrolase [Simkaniaceae bacterium]MCF7852696.1 MBL fold metallo-hydrolase [Simkaniaceae bacterium]
MKNNTITVLGSGSSTGIPVIGCNCSVCKSSNPRNQRLRSSLLIEIENKILVVDTSPDFRAQALSNQIQHIDGVIITHMHYDHIAGIDDLRIFNYRTKMAIPILMHASSYEDFQKKYFYLLKKDIEGMSKKAQLALKVIDGDRGDCEFLSIPIHFFTYEQAMMKVLGFRIHDFAYVTDIRTYSDTIFSDLENVKTLIVSALRESDSPVHFNIKEAIAFAQKVGAEKTYFIHMGHEVEHERISEQLPEGIALSYDGLKIHF